MNQLFDFPFYSGVWGTAADWGLFFITTATLWYLVKTFKSQNKIIELQATANKVQNELYRTSHQPSFTFTAQKFSAISDVENYFEIAITLNSNQANDVTADIQNFGGRIQSYRGTKRHFPMFPPNNIAVLRFTTTIEPSNSDPWADSIKITVLFSDPVGNRYEQECNIRYNQRDLELKHSPVSILKL
ncbi:MAG: hypothetical protein Q8R83_06050 [Legionellaceae bacterium]|nr:hypothetical protein [Legionellaceae bacterium]